MKSVTSAIAILSSSSAIGVAMPIANGQSGYFQQTYTIVDEVKSNLINLLLTRKGERPFQPEFGCDLTNFLFEQMDDTLQTRVASAIQSSVSRWLPYLNINSISVVKDDDHNQFLVNVVFSIKSNSNIGGSITLTF